jgi:hypothetical protein
VEGRNIIFYGMFQFLQLALLDFIYSASFGNLIISSMLSSNSSGFDKDLASTRVYDFDEHVGDASLELVQSIDEFDLEQSCLLRLRVQR